MFRQLLAAGAALVCLSSVASAYDALPQPEKHEKISIVEPQLRIAKGGPASPQVALTLDACMGKTDHRILDVLVENRIPATIFVTARWLKQNAEAFAVMNAHPDLFNIENHGNMHVPAITNAPTMYNIKTAGSLDAVRSEIDGGADAIAKSGASKPQWYRDATARYSTDAVKLAESMGYKIGGYSLNGDQGASLLAPVVARRISAARDGDVIISHINQPTRSAGEGVAKGILALQAKGMKFVKLRDVQTTMTLNPVPAHNLHAIAPAAATKRQTEK
ncbi:polysaccharide deacetylase family protein [Ochrobactrum sp. SD129]|jgi:peptidoglycan/xylan/chitin deacetylase (PgdA/CDA1 family)|uniref:polysaccharide deacetylase family protein n=1 Tax=Brucella sp. TaxID=52132 RepID=UPI000DD855A8|nr:polysaccharide deacetylase family protein [Brucella sp.]MBO1024340.1 polysaccharide deacetylase family protein [Ochrobactrum sp. SD129]